MQRVALATVILSAVALTAAAQQATRVSGRVLAEATGDPIPNARVTLTSPAQSSAAVLTDRDGRFLLSTPPGGVVVTAGKGVTVAASKTGYARREVTASAAEPFEIRMARGAAISGRVVNAFDEPVPAARVVVEVAARSGTGPQTVAAAETDDHGEYRLGSLDPATVKVAVITRGVPIARRVGANEFGRFPSVLKTYYPGTLAAEEAQVIRLDAASERASIDFVLPEGQSGGEHMIISGPLPDTARPAPQNPGVIRGRVVSTDGRPIAHADVSTVIRVPIPQHDGISDMRLLFLPLTETTDGDGRFEFRDLPKGSFRIAAAKAGFANPDGGSAAPMVVFGSEGGVLVDLAEGEIRERVDLTLAPWGTLEGHVLDELGEPLQGASVQLMQVRYEDGRRRLAPGGGSPRLTDDRGRFRLYDIPPGRYVVSATVGDVAAADLPGYTRSYFPGTANAADAQFVSLGVSQHATGIDFSLARAPTALVAGTLLDSTGAPTTGGSIRLTASVRSSGVTMAAMGARIGANGRFEFPNVPPGQYIIHAERGRRNPSTEGEFGVLPVSVNGSDVTGLVLQTSAGSTIAGHVTFDSYLGAKAPVRGQIEISPVPVDSDQAPMAPASAEILGDGSFSMTGVNGPRRLQVRRVPPEWTLKAVRARGIDVTDRAIVFGRNDQSLTDIEVVLTDRIAGVRARIADDHARPAAGARLVVFSMDRDRWYAASRFLRLGEARDDGTVEIAGLPPGSYYGAAIAQIPSDGRDAWQDPAFLESLVPRAASFALGDGDKRVLNLKLP